MSEKRLPMILVFAGPNGSGKSTITSMVDPIGVYINADEIKKTTGCDDLTAAIDAETRRNACIDRKEDFTFETVLSTRRNLVLLRKAKENGYFIKAFFVLTDDPMVNIVRVATRVARGGHDVPKDKIVKRYHASLAILPELIQVCDICNVYDNTAKKPYRIFSKKKDTYRLWESAFFKKDRILTLTGCEAMASHIVDCTVSHKNLIEEHYLSEEKRKQVQENARKTTKQPQVPTLDQLHIIKKEKTNLETAETVTLVQSFTKKTTSESTPDVVKVEFSKPKISGSSLSDALTMPTNRRMDLSDLSHYFHTIIERLKEVAANVLSRLKSAFVLPVAQNTSESPLENSSAEAAQQHTVVLPVAQSVPEYSPAPEKRYMRVSLEEAVALQANGFSFEARLSADGQDKIIEYDAAQESAIKDTLTSFHATKQRYIK